MTTIVDKEVMKVALKELFIEEPDIFKRFFKEILIENENKDEEFEQLIKRNFERFDATYKALA